MRPRVIAILIVIAGIVALFWYIGLYRRPELSPSMTSQTPAPSPSASQPPERAFAAPPTASRTASSPCPRDATDNGMLRLSVLSVATTRQLGFWTLDKDRRFVILEVFLEAITDFQIASSAVLWVEEPDGSTHTRSIATGALARPLLSLSPLRGEGISGQVAFEISAQTRDLKLYYDPFLARQLILCVSVP